MTRAHDQPSPDQNGVAHADEDADARHQGASERCQSLGQQSRRELERVFQSGFTPDLDQLVGWEFRGMNTPLWAYAVGIKKFVKGFYRPAASDEVYGYNCATVQNGLSSPWHTKPSDHQPKRFGFYRVSHVDPTSRDNAHLHAVLLDYSQGGNNRFDPSRGLRDYLVQVDRDDPDIYLGKAYYALGPKRVPVSFFVLERMRQGPTDPNF